jgi:N-acetylmuramoyl-L-alanine amidase
MNRHRARTVSYSLIAAGALLSSSAALAGELSQVMLKADDKGAVLELALDSPTAVKSFSLDNPHRVVIDLPATKGSKALQMPTAAGVVKNLRTGQPQPNTLRLVLDTSSAFSPRVRKFEEAGKARVVIEIGAITSSEPAVAIKSTPAAKPEITDMPPPPRVVSSEVLVDKPRVETAVVIEKKPDIKTETTPAVVIAPPPASAPANATKTVQSVLGNQARKLVVAIDAGHGGKDPGAIGPKGTYEKHITLAVAKELAKQINAEPGMKAFLVRDDDEFVVLQDRFMRARKAQADIFISVHADAAENHAAHGSSVFVLSTKGASSQAARWLADKENAADLVGGVKLDNKDRGLSAVLLDLSQSATMRVSEDVASQVLISLKQLGKAHKKEVERANFVVLRSPDVPSMLVETGFITNPSEEAKLNDPAHRGRLASAIVTGVKGYFSNQPPPGTWFAAQQAQPQQQQIAARDRTHVVARGETLSTIAAQHRVPASQIRQANQKRSDTVKVGERLTIPMIAASGLGSPD